MFAVHVRELLQDVRGLLNLVAWWKQGCWDSMPVCSTSSKADPVFPVSPRTNRRHSGRQTRVWAERHSSQCPHKQKHHQCLPVCMHIFTDVGWKLPGAGFRCLVSSGELAPDPCCSTCWHVKLQPLSSCWHRLLCTNQHTHTLWDCDPSWDTQSIQ